MSVLVSVVLFIIGLGLVSYGANWLVSGASSLSLRLGVAPLVVGLTIVAFGTSMPEFVVSLVAAIKGNADISIGNIVGSNIANILFILGISTFFSSLKVARSTYWKEIPLALLASLALWAVAGDTLLNGSVVGNIISRGDGVVLLLLFGVFMYYIVEMARKNPESVSVEASEQSLTTTKSWLFVIAGLVALVVGGQLFVEHAAILARLAGLSELLIGLTIVSIGTSLPELATSIVAARRGKSDLVIGNIVGSNILNILWILGITAIISPISVASAIMTDIVISIVATVLLIWSIFAGTKGRITRKEGAFMLVGYAGYFLYILMRG